MHLLRAQMSFASNRYCVYKMQEILLDRYSRRPMLIERYVPSTVKVVRYRTAPRNTRHLTCSISITSLERLVLGNTICLFSHNITFHLSYFIHSYLHNSALPPVWLHKWSNIFRPCHTSSVCNAL